MPTAIDPAFYSMRRGCALFQGYEMIMMVGGR
jgi:hypothetical protein